MSAGTLNPVQLPASLRAVDSVADAFHVSASKVSSRVYGHRGGLTVRERYILAEKREAHLKQAREAANQQRDKQRRLRGKLVRVEKNARRMFVQASMPCRREDTGHRTTHSVVASIKSAGAQRSADLSLSRDDTGVGLDIAAHIDKVRAVFERMDHTFNMARARSDLLATINGLRQNIATSTTVCERDENTCPPGDAGNIKNGRKEKTGSLRRSSDDDPGVESPRERYLRRRAATCLQKCTRGRLLRRTFQDLVWPALHIGGAEERCIVGKENRRAMLLAHFRIVRAAYEGLQAVLPAPSNHRAKSENVHQPKPVSTRAPSFGKDATLLPDGEEPEQHETPSGRDSAEGSTPYAAESDNEETGKRFSRGAAKSVRRESNIVLWALRDAAARVVQEETRGYARKRRWLSGSGQRQGAATTDETNVEGAFHESSTREDEDRFDEGYQAADGGLPWGINAHLSTAVTANTSTAASSTRGSTARASTARTTATASSSKRRAQGGSSGQSTPSVLSPTLDSAVSPTWRFPRSSAGLDFLDDWNVTTELEWGSEEAWEGGQLHTQQAEVVSRIVDRVVARWPLLPSEELKKRRNETHLRRNQSRLRHAERGLVNLECQGMFVLPEIIKMQRLFRARRARMICEWGQANQEAQQAAWNAKEARERAERAARWHSSMSRLNIARLLGSKKQRKPFSGIGRKVAQGFCQDEEEGETRQQVLGDLSGKDAPYASAKWSLAVAYDVGSWQGGLRQRYYFGRFTAFIAYRRRRKASLRARVEVRMVKRLQAWAALISEEKRALACEIKARAPAEVVGAHLRFIARTGTWERLLLDLHEILELAVSEREQVVRLLSEEFSSEKPGAPRHVLRTASKTRATSPIPGTRGSTSPSRNTAHPQHPREQCWATSSLGVSRGPSAGRSPHCPVGSRGRTAAGRRISRNASTAESRRLERLRGVVDERTLRRLHPWIISVLAGSDIQFVPSVPQKFRVGYRMDDTKMVELRAETQLIRRYWRLLGGISDAISRVVAAKVEAATLAAEAGEWNLLLGFAHDLVAKGLLDPPCMLPKLRRRNANSCTTDSNMKLLGVMAKQINGFLAPVRRRRAGGGGLGRMNSTSARSSRQTGPAHDPELHCRPVALPGKAEATKQEGSRTTISSVPSWFSAGRNLCESCWAMRTGDSALGGSTCQRCGQIHRRGFSQDVSKRAGDDTLGPVPWQQFSQVKEPLDLFVVHAAYACVLHPGREKGASLPVCGNLGWWNGGDSEETWWRAVCGGKRAAQFLRSHGCNTVGKLYAYVHGSAAAFSSSMSTGRGSGSGRFTRKVRARTKRLQLLVTDDDLAVKLSSLLLRLMSAFEELRAQHRWPTVSKTAVHHAVRKL